MISMKRFDATGIDDPRIENLQNYAAVLNESKTKLEESHEFEMAMHKYDIIFCAVWCMAVGMIIGMAISK